MAIASSDIKYFESTNSTSLGGAITATEITGATLENLFDNVSGSEASSGDTEYRCLYVQNKNVTDTLSVAEIWIQSNTPATGSDIEIGLDPAGKNGTATTVGDEGSAPAGVTFSQPSGSPGLSLGDLAPDDYYAVWVKRVISASAPAYNNDNSVLRVFGDSPA